MPKLFRHLFFSFLALALCWVPVLYALADTLHVGASFKDALARQWREWMWAFDDVVR